MSEGPRQASEQKRVTGRLKQALVEKEEVVKEHRYHILLPHPDMHSNHVTRDVCFT